MWQFDFFGWRYEPSVIETTSSGQALSTGFFKKTKILTFSQREIILFVEQGNFERTGVSKWPIVTIRHHQSYHCRCTYNCGFCYRPERHIPIPEIQVFWYPYWKKCNRSVGQDAGFPRTQTEKTEKTEKTEIAPDMTWQETASFRGLEISCRESGSRVRPRIPGRLRIPRYPLFSEKHWPITNYV